MTYAAAIDIGTHSALLLIARCNGHQVDPQLDLARTTKLGEGLTTTKRISPAALERLIAVLKTYQAILSEYPIQKLTVFATAAFRLAENAEDCRRAITQTFGWPLQILSGDEEARYTFRGVSQLLGPASPAALSPDGPPAVMAIDIGGGSTEVIIGQAGDIRHQWSIPIGAVLLKQQFDLGECLSPADLERIGQFLANHFAAIQGPVEPPQVFVTGGTATTLAALLQELDVYDFRLIDGYPCTLDAIEVLFQELNQLTTAQRADLPGMEAGRADVILPALVILLTLLRYGRAYTVTITIRGARYGVLAAA